MHTMESATSRYAIDRLSVLVVDDHRINREFLGTGLSRTVARVRLAGDGEGAIKLCEREDFDVILMDLHMPRMDGLATANRIRDLGTRSAHARIVALTADARPEERTRLLEAGFDDYLNKPISIADLLAAMEALFNTEAPPQAQTKPAAPTQLIDRSRALAAVNDDAELAARLQDMLSSELDEKLPVLDRLMADRRYSEVTDLLHQWVGASGYAGAIRMSQACEMLRQRLLASRDSSPGTAYLNFLRIAHATRLSLRHL